MGSRANLVKSLAEEDAADDSGPRSEVSRHDARRAMVWKAQNQHSAYMLTCEASAPPVG